MDKVQDELNVYKTVAAMTGSILYRYEAATDTMEYFFGRADLSRYGSMVKDYVQMIQRQRAANPELDADNFIHALKEGRSYFECRAKMTDFMGTVKSYNIIGKAIYDDNNDISCVVGKMSEISEAGEETVKVGKDDSYTDRLTGMYNKHGIKSKLEAACIDKNGAEGAFLDIIIDNLKEAADCLSVSVDSMVINIAQFMERMFPYDVYIGRVRQDEFNVIYYGSDVRNRFLLRLNDFRESLESVPGSEAGVRLKMSGGIYCGPFVPGEEYEIRDKAYKALFSAKYHSPDRIVMYSQKLENSYGEAEWEAVNKALDEVSFDYLLMEKTLEIMSSSGSIEEATSLICKRVARKYGIERIMVQELDSGSRTVNITYEWTDSTHVSGLVDKNRRDDYDLLERIYSNDDIIIVPDTAKWKPDRDTKAALARAGVKSFVRCVFSGNHRISGCIAFECYDRKREWKDNEIKTLKLITQLISSYLIMVRNYNEMLAEKESYETHDTVTGFYKYNSFVKEAERYLEIDKTGKCAILYAGIKSLRDINGRYGYDVGDVVLKGCAEAIASHRERFIMGCRVNADNFIILANVFDSRGSRISTAEANIFTNAFYEKYGDICPGIDVSIDAGISIINDRTLPVEKYIERALEARGRARNSGLDGIMAD